MPLSSPAAGEDDRADAEAAAERSWRLRALVVWPLALVTGCLGMFSGPAGDRPWAHWTEFALATPVQFWGGWPFLREAARRARGRATNMDTLIAVGTLTAYLASVAGPLGGPDDAAEPRLDVRLQHRRDPAGRPRPLTGWGCHAARSEKSKISI